MLAAGTVVDEKFRIIAPLAMGGFGVVYKAEQMAFDRVVALKILQASAEMGQEDVIRFEREARLLSQLKHRNLVLCYGFGVFAGSPYMAMELIQGESLQGLLGRRGKLDASKTIPIIKQVCEALVCAHTYGIVHRDLKPTNIMLCETPEGLLVKLIDFGLAKLLATDSAFIQKLTEAGTTVGTTEYMSPEQCLGQEIDHRSDIYATGCVLYKCLTGTTPFAAEHSVLVMQQHIYEAPKPLSEYLPEGSYPKALQLIVDKALAKERDERYQTMREMLTDLQAIESGQHDTLIALDIPSSTKLKLVAKREETGIPKQAILGVVTLLAAMLAFAFYKMSTTQKSPVVNFDAGTERQRSSLTYLMRAEDKYDPNRVTDDRALRNLCISRYEDALQMNKEDSLIDPNRMAELKARLARLYQLDQNPRKAMGKATDALQLCAQLQEYGDDMELAASVAADSAIKLGEPQTAVRLLAPIERFRHYKTPRMCPVMRAALAESYLNAGDYDKALQVVRDLEADNIPDKNVKKVIKMIKEQSKEAIEKRDVTQ